MEKEIIKEIFMNTVRNCKEQANEKIFKKLEILENNYTEENYDIFYGKLQKIKQKIKIENLK
jgi:hypothetical protein